MFKILPVGGLQAAHGLYGLANTVQDDGLFKLFKGFICVWTILNIAIVLDVTN